MMVAIGSDHAAFEFKKHIKKYLDETDVLSRDFGTHSHERTDYCDYGFRVADAVSRGECERGILLCGTGVGMCISANKVKGIRAVVCSEPYSAQLSRLHNNANVLALGARVVGLDLAKMIIDIWLNTDFEQGRHRDRINKITEYENKRL